MILASVFIQASLILKTTALAVCSNTGTLVVTQCNAEVVGVGSVVGVVIPARLAAVPWFWPSGRPVSPADAGMVPAFTVATPRI